METRALRKTSILLMAHWTGGHSQPPSDVQALLAETEGEGQV